MTRSRWEWLARLALTGAMVLNAVNALTPGPGWLRVLAALIAAFCALGLVRIERSRRDYDRATWRLAEQSSDPIRELASAAYFRGLSLRELRDFTGWHAENHPVTAEAFEDAPAVVLEYYRMIAEPPRER